MAIKKIQPGESLSFTVARIVDADGEYGKRLRFLGATADDTDAAFHLSFDTADRQLERNHLTRDTVIGRTIIFTMKKLGVKKVIDITVPEGERPAAPIPPLAAPAAPHDPEAVKAARKAQFDHDLDALEKCVSHVFKRTLPNLRAKHKIDIPDDACIPLGAALFQVLASRSAS